MNTYMASLGLWIIGRPHHKGGKVMIDENNNIVYDQIRSTYRSGFGGREWGQVLSIY